MFFRLSEPSVIVRSCETVYPPLLLATKSLAAPAFDISQDQLVHKVMYTKFFPLIFVKRLNFEALSINTHFYFKTVVIGQRKKINEKRFYVKSVKSQGIKNLNREIVQIYSIWD